MNAPLKTCIVVTVALMVGLLLTAEADDLVPIPDDGRLAGSARGNDGVVVAAIHFADAGRGSEKVCLELPGDAVPWVKALPGDRPRVFMDFTGISRWTGPKGQRTNGPLVSAIRAHLHRQKKTLRIVLDLEPMLDYRVDQAFYEDAHVFCIYVESASHRP